MCSSLEYYIQCWNGEATKPTVGMQHFAVAAAALGMLRSVFVCLNGRGPACSIVLSQLLHPKGSTNHITCPNRNKAAAQQADSCQNTRRSNCEAPCAVLAYISNEPAAAQHADCN